VTQTSLFIFGGIVTIIVFAGLFTYLMFSFSRWSVQSNLDTDRSVAR
jgi:hypothetical protein